MGNALLAHHDEPPVERACAALGWYPGRYQEQTGIRLDSGRGFNLEAARSAYASNGLAGMGSASCCWAARW